MRFRRLKLAGFKSFVEPAELRIEPGLTGVVGPNGCGKSNLLEAIRWVMGESSARSLRGGGMEDVIFAGTARRPIRDFAEVALTVERSPAELLALGLDAREVELEVVRRIERGAGSAYRVNGKDVRARDVALLFADAATGAHSPALVSQGRVAAVIAARPQERRAMLEEAAGIAGLHVRRKDAESKLRQAEANLERLDTILTDMAARAAALKRQARAAERYRALSEAIRTAEGRLIWARWREAKGTADAARAEAASATAAVEKAQGEHAALAETQRAATEATAAARTALALAREEAATLAQARVRAESAAERLAERIAELDRQERRIAEERSREDSLTRSAVEALDTLEDEAADLAALIRRDEAARPEVEARRGRANEAVRAAELALARAEAEDARIRADIKVADAALAQAEARARRSAEQLARIDAEAAAAPDVAALSRARDSAMAARDEVADELAAHAAASEAARGQLPALADAVDAARNRLADLTATATTLRSEAAALDKALAAATEAKTRAIDVVRAVPGYERALAAALGEELEAALGGNSGRRWTQPGTSPVHACPTDAEPLAPHVAAPAELAARLATIFVAEQDAGQSLPIGTRLVTLDGTMRRWDGYRSDGEGASAADRLARLNRREAVTREMAATEAAREAAAQGFADAEQLYSEARRRLADLDRLRADADNRLRTCLRAADAAEDALARAALRQEDLAQRRAAIAPEVHEAVAERAAAAERRAQLPDGGAEAAAVRASDEARRLAADHARTAEAALSALDQALAAQRERRAAVQADLRGWKARADEAARRLQLLGEQARELAAARAQADGDPAALAAEVERLTDAHAAAGERVRAAESEEREADVVLRQVEQRSAAAAEALAGAREARAGAEARAESADARRIEMGRIAAERFECPAAHLPDRAGFIEADVGAAQDESAALDRLTADRERLGPVNLVAADELAALESEEATGRSEADELGQAIARLRGSIGALNREGRVRLSAAFEAVDGHFRRLFVALFGGGQAHLAMVDSDDPLEAGLEIFAQPPGKKLATLTLLSGGEQALTAVALIFALFLTNPAPICVLDEVDAPLDDANVERFCDLLDAMVRETDTRYLIVTHNAVTMSRMHRLFGVTMIEPGVSRLVSVDLGGAEELLAAE